mgnify:CR=1 FL=1
MGFSVNQQKYLDSLHESADIVYAIAEQARSQGFDPKPNVEIPKASDLADRTQKLLDFLHPRNTAKQIRELTKKFDGNRELVAIEIAKIVCAETYLYGKIQACGACDGKGETKQGTWVRECYDCSGTGNDIGFTDKINKIDYKQTLTDFNNINSLWKPNTESQRLSEMAVYHGVCAGLAVITEGILVAPLEGVVSARFINDEGGHSLALSFAGPIRSAGGTGQALSVLIADILRRDFGLKAPTMSFGEIERYKEEVSAYGRGLQHRPSNPQIEEIVKSCPIYIDGEGVGNEVTGQRDLPRVKTNKVREGMLLVVCEGLVLKAPKILKYVDALKLNGWEWLRPFAKSTGKSADNEVKPNTKYIADVLAGRPIFSQPMAEGGFRLRYGRSRLAGLAATSVHPASMQALSGFIIIGTQMKYERPGKATVVTPCDTIDGPYIQFKDGSGKMVNDMSELPFQYPTDPNYTIEKIWDMGEILIPVGEFIENNHALIESPYVAEWHNQVLEEKGLNIPLDFQEALTQSKKYEIPIHPDYVPFFNNISPEELLIALKETNSDGFMKNPKYAYRICMDVGKNKKAAGKKADIWQYLATIIGEPKIMSKLTTVDFVNELLKPHGVYIRPRVTYRIGARMGKPEGSKMREMKPPIHSLYTVGHKVGSKRLLVDAVSRQDAKQSGVRYCEACSTFTTKGVCSICNGATLFDGIQWIGKDDELWAEINPKIQWETAIDKVKSAESKVSIPIFGEANNIKYLGANPNVKGVKGMTSKEKLGEDIAKGLLRYKNNISTFRDGTIRFDMVDITMTHFKPVEIGMDIHKAEALGYDISDISETVGLKAQDVVLPMNCVENLLNTTRYVDDLLVTLYGLEPFYNCESQSDLIGQLIMGIAPHTSGAILARIVGFADIKGHYGHPFFHAAKRRNCDGDIDAIILLLDGLLNFSRSFLPGNRGGLMDAPLILTTTIEPTEIDKEALNVDVLSKYPITFYEGTMNRPPAKSASKLGIKTVETLIEEGKDPFISSYTHETRDACESPKNNPYNTLESMRQKTMMQFELGNILHCVDNKDQAGRLINRHLIRDMRGNLRAYGQQKVRCTKCGESYRRVPIAGKCINIIKKGAENPMTGEIEDISCNHKLILTVHKGSVKKYDGLIRDIIERWGVDDYTDNLYHLVSGWVRDSFEAEDEKRQTNL